MVSLTETYKVTFDAEGHPYIFLAGSIGYSIPTVVTPDTPFSGQALMSEKEGTITSFLNGNGPPPNVTILDAKPQIGGEAGCAPTFIATYDAGNDLYKAATNHIDPGNCSQSPIYLEFPWDGSDIQSISMVVDAVGSSCFSVRSNTIEVDTGSGYETVHDWGDCGDTEYTRTANGPFYNVTKIRLLAHRRRNSSSAYTRLKAITIVPLKSKAMEVETQYPAGTLKSVNARFMVEYTGSDHDGDEVTFKLEAGNTEQVFTIPTLASGVWQQVSWTGSIADSSSTRASILHKPSVSGGATGIKFYLDELNVTVDYSTATDAPLNDGGQDCPATSAGAPFSRQPINLLTGNKHERITDLAVNTAAGSLAFIRSYMQNKLDVYTFMGRGWTHNHHLVLLPPASGKIIMRLPSGGEAHFTETTSTHYDGVAGVSSYIDIDTGSTDERYTVTMGDKSIYVFDSDGKLRSRTWPNDETWTYTYYTSLDGIDLEDKLKRVSDDYNRYLEFTYIRDTDPNAFQQRKLHRVTDHSGRYVEFGYEQEAEDGLPVTNGEALLTSVVDVRGQTWTYQYYGSNSGETDSNQLNFLVAVLSPAVDVDGDSVLDGAITLKNLDYTFQSSTLETVVERMGKQGTSDYLQEITYNFQPSGQPFTEEIIGTKVTRHHFLDNVYAGPENPNQERTKQYTNVQQRPFLVRNARGYTTAMEWSSDGKQLTGVQDALGAKTQFSYDSEDRLAASLDAEDRLTLYAYENADAPRQPTLILVTDSSNLAVNGDMENDSNWSSVGTLIINEQSDIEVDRGNYARHVSGDQDEGIESANWTVQENHTYLILARVFPVNSGDQIKLHVDGMTDVLSQGDGAWETLRGIYTATANGSKSLQFLAATTTAEFYVDSVFIIEDSHILHWQEYTYDTKGRITAERLIDPSDGVTLLQETVRLYYTSGDGNGLLQSITQTDIDGGNDVTTTYTYDSAGRVVQVNQNTTFGNCTRSRTVYDAAGNVIASLCNFEPGTINLIYPTTVAQAQELRQRLYDDQDADHYTDPNTNRLTLHVYDALGRRVQTIQNAEDLDDEQITLTFYDALSRVVRTISNYDPQGSSAPGDWVWNAAATPEPRWEDGSNNAIDHGTDNTKNIIADTDYNARGMVRFQRDVLGNVTLLGYNDAGRLVKTIRNASYQEYNNDYIGPSPDPELSGYTFVSDPDQDIITLNEYDPVGNLVKTTDPLGQVSFTVYDALNRPVKMVRNAHANATVSLNPGDIGYDAAHDPRVAEYAISVDPDQDQITTTEYDSLGRVIRTQQLLENRDSTAAWMTTLYGYDALGRQVISIRSASQPNYDIAADPDLSDYVASSAADLDIISTTTYNAEGRVLAAANVNGTLTRSVYDGLGRPVRTIASYSANGEDPANWVWDATDNQWEQSDGTAIAHGSDNDENIISHTVYDADGRVLETVDVLGRVTRQVYDDLGRQVRTVSNYVDNSTLIPPTGSGRAASGRMRQLGRLSAGVSITTRTSSAPPSMMTGVGSGRPLTSVTMKVAWCMTPWRDGL